MSTVSLSGRDQLSWPWLCSLFAMAVLSASYLGAFYRAVNIDGDPALFFLVVVGSIVLGYLLGRFVGPLVASVCVGLLTAGGALLYVSTIPAGYSLVISIDAFYTDLIALLTGLSIIRIINAGVWATAVAPIPAFLTAYFIARHQYSRATLVGCLALCFLILTGDIGTTVGLIGVLGATAAVGFGDLARRGSDLSGAETLVIVLAVIVVLTTTVHIVPGGESTPVVSSHGGDAETVEGSLTHAGSQLPIQGAINLSPTVRFTIESEQRAYWRVGTYDRYTGSRWIRTADTNPYDGSLSEPPGETQTVRQRVRVNSPISVLPAAWKPINIDGRSPRVTGFDGLQPTEQLDAGENYTVTSAIPVADPTELRNADTEYPDTLHSQYTQLPSSTPNRVKTYTDQLTENANNSYDTARIIERHLQQKWDYSLNARRPDNPVADSFIFEMQRGYCTHFATAMVAMLRTQDIPARIAVGYTPGERVDANRWVVRGLNSHAWVEVYFPEHGWIRFDPTPAAPREQAEQLTIESARSSGVENVDTNETEPTPTPTPGENVTQTNVSPGQTPVNGSSPTGPNQRNLPPGIRNTGTTTTNDGFSLPSWNQVLFATVVLFGVVATMRRSGANERAYRAVWLRRQPRTNPKRDIERAFDRLEYLLERNHRPRRPGETRRQYVRAVGDDNDRRVAEIYEQAVYAGSPTQALAEKAIELVDGQIRLLPRIDTLGWLRR